MSRTYVQAAVRALGESFQFFPSLLAYGNLEPEFAFVRARPEYEALIEGLKKAQADLHPATSE